MALSVERSDVLRFGVFEVDRACARVAQTGHPHSAAGAAVSSSRCCCSSTPASVVTRDELRQELWPSSVYVDFDHGLNNAIARLREALGDAAATPHFIETLPRLGYRFIYPLGTPIEDTPAPQLTEQVAPRSSSAADAVPTTETRFDADLASLHRVASWPPESWPRSCCWLCRSACGSRGSLADPVAEVSPAKQPSIAVLPFINMSSDEESEHFADGLSEEIAIKLAGIRGLTVAGRTSSFYFKGKRESLAVMAQTLKVNHLLEGSVRRSGTRLRITAQLVDAAEGNRLWSQTFDRNLTDIFKIQEEIALAVAMALQVNLLDTDEQRLHKRGTHDAEAYRLYVVANAYLTGVSVTQDCSNRKAAIRAGNCTRSDVCRGLRRARSIPFRARMEHVGRRRRWRTARARSCAASRRIGSGIERSASGTRQSFDVEVPFPRRFRGVYAGPRRLSPRHPARPFQRNGRF